MIEYGFQIAFLVLGVIFIIVLLLGRKERPKKQRTADCDARHADKEINRLEKLRSIHLNVPLAEKTRPKDFSEMVGQEDGLLALEAALCGPNPQHVIVYGPPGIGKTAAARLALEKAKKSAGTPFRPDAKMIEVDGATSRFDERGIADPLLGSVHDPIYQGAGSYGQAGIPQPKEGAVSKAHGGVLFIDEIGELHPIQLNKLLKVLEDRKVMLESSYYQPENTHFPKHIHDIFQKGLPADFRLIAATTRNPEELPPALRSRCLEIFFRSLRPDELKRIATVSAVKSGFVLPPDEANFVANYAANGREVVNMVQLAAGMAQRSARMKIERKDLNWVVSQGRYNPHPEPKMPEMPRVGVAVGLGVSQGGEGSLLELEALAMPGKGERTLTGIVDEEELGGNGHKIRRRSMAMNSVDNVVTVLKSRYKLEVDKYDFHLNFPGGIPVDGPSAGITMAAALYSALEDKPVDHCTAMTGEISILGRVLPVGGVSAKIGAAVRAGAKRVIIPKENWQESYEESGTEIVPVADFDEVLQAVIKG